MIVLVTATLLVIWLQVREMQRTYRPIKESADVGLRQVRDAENALKLAQRAWVGPNNAALTIEPQPGKPIDVNITYQNSGREPALDFIYDIDPFVTDNNLTNAVSARIGSYQHACQTATRPSGGSVVYPTTGFSSYTLTRTVSANTFDERFFKGQEILVIQGCFWYRTFKMQKHSYFCYFYNPKRTKIANLNICTIGADAN